jgi:hypothetical protein
MDSIRFLLVWHNVMIIGAIVMTATSLLIYLVHKMRVSAIQDPKEKHDYINANEVRWYRWSFIALGAGAAMGINLYGLGQSFTETLGLWFFVRIFFSLAGAVLIAYVASMILKYYYPTMLNYKLRRWRYLPRVNPKTGNKMRLLTEEEEDVHLSEGMQSEENIFSIDYDVWIDEKTGDVKIEKYNGRLIASQCGNCGFYTMRIWKEEVSEKNEDGTPNEIIKHYRCEYCKTVRATAFHVSKREEQDYRNLKPGTKRNTKGIEVVKVEIYSALTGKMNFEFGTLEEAQKFMEEFDPEKAA